MKPRVFIDGEAGTTGLKIAARLTGRRDLELVSLDSDRRKDMAARADIMNACDAVILCLPDEASRLAVDLVENDRTVIIDASTAFRTAPGWVYGLPELDHAQRAAIAAARRISNPGCYPTGFIVLVRPLIKAGLVPPDWPFIISAVSGYSGGGKSMIAEFEKDGTRDNFRIYGLGQAHKHVPEMMTHAGLARTPMFMPSVGRFAQGMLVEVPLLLAAAPGMPRRSDIHAALAQAYRNEAFIRVIPLADCDQLATLDPEGCNGTNRLELYVFGHDAQVRLVARLDNLGKGASGAAVQNLNLALGLDESAGLER